MSEQDKELRRLSPGGTSEPQAWLESQGMYIMYGAWRYANGQPIGNGLLGILAHYRDSLFSQPAPKEVMPTETRQGNSRCDSATEAPSITSGGALQKKLDAIGERVCDLCSRAINELGIFATLKCGLREAFELGQSTQPVQPGGVDVEAVNRVIEGLMHECDTYTNTGECGWGKTKEWLRSHLAPREGVQVDPKMDAILDAALAKKFRQEVGLSEKGHVRALAWLNENFGVEGDKGMVGDSVQIIVTTIDGKSAGARLVDKQGKSWRLSEALAGYAESLQEQPSPEVQGWNEVDSVCPACAKPAHDTTPSRDEVIEDCAKVVESMKDTEWSSKPKTYTEVAAALRKLKQPTTSEEKE